MVTESTDTTAESSDGRSSNDATITAPARPSAQRPARAAEDPTRLVTPPREVAAAVGGGQIEGPTSVLTHPEPAMPSDLTEASEALPPQVARWFLVGIVACLGLVLFAVLATRVFSDDDPPDEGKVPTQVDRVPAGRTAARPPVAPAPPPVPEISATLVAELPPSPPPAPPPARYPVVFKAPSGTVLISGTSRLPANRPIDLAAGPLQYGYRCPGRRAAHGNRTVTVEKSRDVQVFAVPCRR
jgi:hypothetical protein